jgi:hypothetical protein
MPQFAVDGHMKCFAPRPPQLCRPVFDGGYLLAERSSGGSRRRRAIAAKWCVRRAGSVLAEGETRYPPC